MLRIKKYVSGFLFGVCITALFPSCINDYNDDSQCETVGKGDSSEEGVTFEFSLVTRNAAGFSSRALIEQPEGTTMDGSLAENYLDLDNLTFLLFDNNRKLLRVFSPEVEAEDTDTYIKYKVRAFLNDRYFLRATTDDITFTIVVLGNYAGLEPRRFAYHIGQSLEEVFAADKVGTFAMPKSNGGNGWIPTMLAHDGLASAHIPMAGMQTFTVSVAALRASTVDNPYQLSSEVGGKDINMLRALAKIEVTDNITPLVENAEGVVSRIEKVELVGYNTRGSIVPLLGQWNVESNPYETQYVTSVSIPTGTDGASYIGAAPETNLTVTNGNALVDFFKTEDTGKPVFVCYLTEYAPVGDDFSPMWIRITTSTGAEGTSSTLHRLAVAPYTGNAPGAAMPILRNNIYRYEITGISPTLQLTLTVQPWAAETVTWDYSDNLAFTTDGYLEWTGGDVTEATAQVLYSNNTTLVGTFAFDQPRGGSTWHAALIPANTDTPGEAFYFVDEGGNRLDAAPSGTINGSEAKIRIAAVPNTTDKNWAVRLVFTVNTFDGRTITANVLDPNTYGTNKYFTITQNAQQ